jgi:hypothetical protein
VALPSRTVEVDRTGRADSRHHRTHVHAPLIRYVIFTSLLIGACASYAATGRITASLVASLALVWCWVPVLHVIIARLIAGPRGAALLEANAPWALWLLASSAAVGTFGYPAYDWMILLALIPIALTLRIVYTFSRDVLGDDWRKALARTAVHQGFTWLAAAIYLDRAVSLVPRIQGWLS